MASRNTKSRKISLMVILIIFTLSLLLVIPASLYAQEGEEGEATEEPAAEEEVEEETALELTFDTTFPELKARLGESFEFSMDLLYKGTDERQFDLTVDHPDGWYVSISPEYETGEISAVKLEPDNQEGLKVTATPLIKQDPGEYDIIVAASNEDLGLEASIELKAIITSTYEIDLTSKSGKLDTEATAGRNNNFALTLENTGSASIEDITFTTEKPEGWRVEYDPEEIDSLAANDLIDINMNINPPDETIAGDYIVTVTVEGENSTDKIDVRVTVLTPSILGYVGIGIIVIVVIGIAVIFARLGRR